MSFPNRLHTLRTEKGLSQKKLAELSGLSQSSIYQWEKGTRKPKAEQLEKLAVALNISISELFETPVFIEVISHNPKFHDDSINTRLSEYFNLFHTKTINQDTLLFHFEKLNFIGKCEAIKRIEELTEIKKYID